MDPFVSKVLLSLIIGIVWVVISTQIAERVSGKIGGLLIGMPSTAVISLLFVGLTQGTQAAIIASTIVPFSSGVYCFYYISYLLLSKKGFWIGFVSSLAVWFLFGFFSTIYSPDSIAISILVWLLLVPASVYWVVKNVRIDHSQIPKEIKSNPLWIKALLTGIVISLIVVISKIAGPRWGGVFATFPAMVVSTMLITVKSGGVEFTRLIAKNVLISTTTTISLFAIFCYYMYPLIGVVFGTVLAYLLLILVSVPFYFLVVDKLKE